MCFKRERGITRIDTRTKYATEASSHLSLEWLVLHFPWVLGCQHLGFLHDLRKAIRLISYQQLILILPERNELGMG